MVAITTDTSPRRPSFTYSRAAAPVALHPQGDGLLPSSLGLRLLLALVAVVAVLTVAVGTAALGRVLDAQRGIPTSSSAPVTVDG